MRSVSFGVRGVGATPRDTYSLRGVPTACGAAPRFVTEGALF